MDTPNAQPTCAICGQPEVTEDHWTLFTTPEKRRVHLKCALAATDLAIVGTHTIAQVLIRLEAMIEELAMQPRTPKNVELLEACGSAVSVLNQWSTGPTAQRVINVKDASPT